MKKLVALVMTALCLLAVGCSKQEDDQIIDVVVPSTPEAVVTPVPTPETPAETPAPAYTSPYTEQIAAQKAKNDETVGWIKIQGTNIDYPIMYDATGKLGYSGKDADGTTGDGVGVMTQLPHALFQKAAQQAGQMLRTPTA